MGAPARLDDSLFSAWLDGELDSGQRVRVEAWLREHPEDTARVRLWAADRDALRARFDPVLDEPLPASLRQLVAGDTRRRAPRWRRVAAAIGLVSAGAAVGAALTWWRMGGG